MIHILKIAYRKLRHSYLLNSYNDFTIAEHFRKQGARIGDHNRLEIRSLGPEPYLITIGNHCTVATNVQFITHDGAVWVFAEEIPHIQKFGPITLQDNCFIGSSVTILPNVVIGSNSVVGAGSIVTKNVAPNTIVAGNPAKKITTLAKYRKKAIESWKHQKPQGYFSTLQKNKHYSPQEIQNLKTRDLQLLRKHLENLFLNKTENGIAE